ncbi:unnamed protein product [Nezara viridula]|uniref:Uncharacterized protein n=1 Tax=Nezara viridula TaxID=85310 RepID=A0A9P0H6L5_NEZVI|nr:unnamed protein product [Nezara viridula]
MMNEIKFKYYLILNSLRNKLILKEENDAIARECRVSKAGTNFFNYCSKQVASERKSQNGQLQRQYSSRGINVEEEAVSTENTTDSPSIDTSTSKVEIFLTPGILKSG